MKLKAVQIENYRAIKALTLNLDPQLTVLHGANGCGKTTILTAIALAFAPAAHTAGRRVEVDRHLGFLPYPKIQLVGDNSPQTEAVVLIDEVELHLHPGWQQHILPDLMSTFPNAQFVVSTHSPQVLSTIHPQHVVELATENGNIIADGAAAATYGAQAGDVTSCTKF